MWHNEFLHMIKEKFPKLHTSLQHDMEKRRGLRIPLDEGNSRILRDSISNYMGNVADVQSDMVSLEKLIDAFQDYCSRLCWHETPEEEQITQVEQRMNEISVMTRRIRMASRQLEPKVQHGDTTIDSRTSRTSMRSLHCTQYHTMTIMLLATMSQYKDSIDAYYTRLITSAQHRPSAYWNEQQNSVMAHTPLLLGHFHTLQDELAMHATSIKQNLANQQQLIDEREKRIKEWHKLLSPRYVPRVSVSVHDDISSSGRASYDIETALMYQSSKKRIAAARNGFEIRKCVLAFLVTLTLVGLIIGIVVTAMVLLLNSKDYQWHSVNGTELTVTTDLDTTKSRNAAVEKHNWAETTSKTKEYSQDSTFHTISGNSSLFTTQIRSGSRGEATTPKQLVRLYADNATAWRSMQVTDIMKKSQTVSPLNSAQQHTTLQQITAPASENISMQVITTAPTATAVTLETIPITKPATTELQTSTPAFSSTPVSAQVTAIRAGSPLP